ncbi:M48 family metallopeptidase [Paraburkholderia sp.]|uniref:M48 family metallopeptidase n=1 Tax=Paraburkholderia sp. TaxID=1926495 RepID=UPI003D6FA041
MGATRYYDGHSAAAHAATLVWDDAALVVTGALSEAGGTGEFVRWPLARIEVGEPDPDGAVALSCRGEAGRVLTDYATLPPELIERSRGHALGWLAWTAFGILAFAVAFVLIERVPAFAAALVPAKLESRLGSAVEAPLLRGRRVCSGRAGQQALETLEARLARTAGIGQPVQLVVIDDARVNALTLPGARMIVMRGLIDHVGSADQLAGVMAHETAHIAHRDPLRALFRSAGIGLLSTAVGVNVGFVDVSSWAGHLARLSFSRDMERAADADGVAYLQGSGLRSDGLASFFVMLEHRGRGGDDPPAFLSDHPRTAEREAQNQGSALGDSALTPEQWAAVRAMCVKAK